MSGHTPGPWTVGGSFDNDGVTEIVIERIADKGTLAVAVALAGLLGQVANARLIAAAPDLLEQLQMCVEALKDSGHYPLTLFDARAAIAKATGEAT